MQCLYLCNSTLLLYISNCTGYCHLVLVSTYNLNQSFFVKAIARKISSNSSCAQYTLLVLTICTCRITQFNRLSGIFEHWHIIETINCLRFLNILYNHSFFKDYELLGKTFRENKMLKHSYSHRCSSLQSIWQCNNVLFFKKLNF